MSEAHKEDDALVKPAPHPWLKLVTELGPLVLFFAANAKFGIFIATAIFMVAIVVALIASYVLTKHLPAMAIVTAVLVLVFGALTLILQDDTFIKLKPTIIYLGFAAMLLGGIALGRNLLSLVFDQMFDLTLEGWRKLTIRWALFFVAMALLNEIVWRTQTTDAWVTFKAFGVMPITIVFAMAQFPFIRKYAVAETPDETAK